MAHKITVQVCFDKARLETINEMAEQAGVSRSAFINMAVSEYMKGRNNA